MSLHYALLNYFINLGISVVKRKRCKQYTLFICDRPKGLLLKGIMVLCIIILYYCVIVLHFYYTNRSV